MAGFHLPGDPYFPNQGNKGLLEEEPEEEPEELEVEPKTPAVDFEEQELDVSDKENEEDDSDAESEVINPPYMDRVPAHRMGPNGPTTSWAHDIRRRSRHQGMRPPFGMDGGFFDLSHCGPADRSLSVMVRRNRDISNQAEATADQMNQVRAAIERVEG